MHVCAALCHPRGARVDLLTIRWKLLRERKADMLFKCCGAGANTATQPLMRNPSRRKSPEPLESASLAAGFRVSVFRALVAGGQCLVGLVQSCFCLVQCQASQAKSKTKDGFREINILRLRVSDLGHQHNATVVSIPRP